MKRNRVLAVVVAVGSCMPLHAAAERSVEATAGWCPGFELLSSTEVAPQQMIAAYKVAGGIRSSSPDKMFDMMNGVCHGALSTVGGQITAAGNCLWVDKDGDEVVFSYSRLMPAPGKLQFTSGTGKFSGIKGAGEYITMPLPAIGNSRNSCPEARFKFTLPN